MKMCCNHIDINRVNARYQDMQSGSTECKKTFSVHGSDPDTAGKLTALPQTSYLVGRGWLPLLKNLSRSFRPLLS